MAVSGSHLAWLISTNAQPLVRAYGQWVNEHIIPIANDFEQQANAIQNETYARLSDVVIVRPCCRADWSARFDGCSGWIIIFL